MKIVIDSAIPFVRGVLEPYAEVVYLDAKHIDREAVRDADALIIRTRTHCNGDLLDGSRVHFIATATIGYDHIDLEYCAERNIAVTTAAGCNAGGVLQWVAASLQRLLSSWNRSPEGLKLGIVGVGNVGRLVEMHAAYWGFEVLCCDPPRAERESEKEFYSLEELLPKVDILTLHTPLNITTRGLINSENIGLLQSHAAIINSSRGEVLSPEALRFASSHSLLLDVWNGEPNIDREILARALVSTFHIAGYSIQGKANATAISVGALSRYFDLPLDGWYPEGVDASRIALTPWEDLSGSYDIASESELLKNNPESFEQLRTSYDFRNEEL